MTIIQFLKLLKKNILLIIIIPLILGSVVWFFTRNEIKQYSSKTTIYTGIGSGLSLESQSSSRLDFFGSKMEFDNIINLFKARETHKEVGIRLFVQALSLKSWDPRYISKINYIRIHESTPDYIKNMVVERDTMSLEDLLNKVPLVLNDTASLSDKKLIFENVWYDVHHDETLFSLSDKFSIPVSQLMNWNSLVSTDLVEGQSLIVRRIEKVIYSSGLNSIDTIDLYVPDPNFFIKTMIDSSAFEESVNRFKEYADANDTNYIYRLLNKGHAHYSIAAISKNSAKRIQGSDLVQISYQSSDPGITQQTLVFLVYSFEKYYRKLKENQSDHIVAYFEKRVKESAALLIGSENRLLKFNQDNNIINYYEQTRHISDQKEQLDSRYYDEKMKYTAADSVITNLEGQLQTLKGITGLNRVILEQRNKISDITYKIAINELNDNKDPKAVAALHDLRNEAKNLKSSISLSLDSIFQLKFTPEGISEKDIVSQWLFKIIEYEESKATLAALYDRKKEFQKTYEIFAPLGAKLKRIEREIDVYEQQYLSHLNSLNQAKLKQQNLEFKSNIKVVDPAFFPLRPEASKRKLMIAAAAIVGLVLVLFVILALEYLDSTLKYGKRAEKYTSLEVASTYPLILKENKHINYTYIRDRSIQILIQRVRSLQKEFLLIELKRPIYILIFSTERTDGKSLIQEEMCNELRRLGHSVLSVNYNDPNANVYYKHEQSNLNDYQVYEITNDYFNKNSIVDLLTRDGEPIKTYNYDYIVLEIPSLIRQVFPPKIIEEIDISIMITRSNRTWQKADISSLKSISKFLVNPPICMLNGVNIDLMADLIGEIPRKRSRLRRMMKKVIRLQVFERYQVKK